MKKTGADAAWMKLSAYQAFQYAQLGLILRKKQKRGRYLIIMPMRPDRDPSGSQKPQRGRHS